TATGKGISNPLMAVMVCPKPYGIQLIPPAVDIQTLPESDVENSTTSSPSFSCSENVKSPRIICNKSGVNNRKRWISSIHMVSHLMIHKAGSSQNWLGSLKSTNGFVI
ncbi:hypothetical protein Tco_0427271, partial [Tanacetum coccineum]